MVDFSEERKEVEGPSKSSFVTTGLVELVENSEKANPKSETATHRIGQVLTMGEDFFSYTYISMLSHMHLLVVIF